MDTDFINVKMMREVKESEYEKKWNGLAIDGKIFSDYYGIHMRKDYDPSSEEDYKKAVDEVVKDYMELYRDMMSGYDNIEDAKEDMGPKFKEHTEEGVKKFFTTPIGNGNLKKGYIILSTYHHHKDHYYPVEVTSETPFTYGMILLANFSAAETHKIEYPCPSGAKIGFSDTHFVFELFTDT
jgi:hypothetical protein